ncbi:hypothetical protein [Desulfonatronum parangueonense]
MGTKRITQRPSADQTPQAIASESGHDFDDILELAHAVNELHCQAAANCAPMVRDMIRSRTQDRQQIEHMLDRLLDCAYIPEGLALFRSLCRYYYAMDPAATASYVHAYREMWDSEESGKEQVS